MYQHWANKRLGCYTVLVLESLLSKTGGQFLKRSPKTTLHHSSRYPTQAAKTEDGGSQ
jgi:hypothetical protein